MILPTGLRPALEACVVGKPLGQINFMKSTPAAEMDSVISASGQRSAVRGDERLESGRGFWTYWRGSEERLLKSVEERLAKRLQ